MPSIAQRLRPAAAVTAEAAEPGFFREVRLISVPAGRRTGRRMRCFVLEKRRALLYAEAASRPGSRAAQRAERPRGEESPGSAETRCRITSGGGNPRESATESKPPDKGKGERVG